MYGLGVYQLDSPSERGSQTETAAPFCPPPRTLAVGESIALIASAAFSALPSWTYWWGGRRDGFGVGIR